MRAFACGVYDAGSSFTRLPLAMLHSYMPKKGIPAIPTNLMVAGLVLTCRTTIGPERWLGVCGSNPTPWTELSS